MPREARDIFIRAALVDSVEREDVWLADEYLVASGGSGRGGRAGGSDGEGNARRSGALSGAERNAAMSDRSRANAGSDRGVAVPDGSRAGESADARRGRGSRNSHRRACCH